MIYFSPTLPTFDVKVRRVCLTAFSDHRHHLEFAQHVRNTAVLCQVWPLSESVTSRASHQHWRRNPRKMEYWFSSSGSGSLGPPMRPRCQESLHYKISSGPGRITKHTTKHNKLPSHSTDSARRSLYNSTRRKLGSTVTSRPGLLHVQRILCLAPTSIGYRSRAKWRLQAFKGMSEGGRLKLDQGFRWLSWPCLECRRRLFLGGIWDCKPF